MVKSSLDHTQSESFGKYRWTNMLLNGVLVEEEFLYRLSPSGSLRMFKAADSNPYYLNGSVSVPGAMRFAFPPLGWGVPVTKSMSFRCNMIGWQSSGFPNFILLTSISYCLVRCTTLKAPGKMLMDLLRSYWSIGWIFSLRAPGWLAFGSVKLGMAGADDIASIG